MGDNLARISKSNKQTEPIDKEVQELAATLAQDIAEEEAYKPNQLLPKQALIERYKQEIEKGIIAHQKRLENGGAKILNTLVELSKDTPEMLSKDVITLIKRIRGLSAFIDKDEARFNKLMSRGISLQELILASDETVDKLYQAALHLYDKMLFVDASDAFIFLTTLNPHNPAFWLGLGGAEYCLKHYKEALRAYDWASELAEGGPTSHLICSRCHEALGELDHAINALDQALRAVEQNQEHTDWKQSLQEEKARLKQLLQHREV